MSKPSSFQEIILKLQDFWASHGCLITQPYYTQVGAGTMNPATFLRVVGLGALHRVARVAELLKLHALDHAAGVDVEAGNDSAGEHAKR